MHKSYHTCFTQSSMIENLISLWSESKLKDSIYIKTLGTREIV